MTVFDRNLANYSELNSTAAPYWTGEARAEKLGQLNGDFNQKMVSSRYQ